jgi:hypothetical protein
VVFALTKDYFSGDEGSINEAEAGR